jgi:uncharacterized protein with NRDE domain
MCTVTFIPAGDKIFITHNRDEKSIRSKAISPKDYKVNGYTLLFPRDSQAGGTWIGLHENGNAAVLLNGAFVKHVHKPPYSKSRGLAFLDITASDDLMESWNKTNLNGIEPFTVILWNAGDLYECRWDGDLKHSKDLKKSEAHTWSSVTLYDTEVINKRQQWFRKWLQQQPILNTENIIQFHLSAGDGDVQNDLRMNRNGLMLTVSVTAMELSANTGKIHYLDLQDGISYNNELFFTKARVNK